MKVSISLPDELVRYIDDRVENRSSLVELLLQAWRKQQEQQAMIEACLLLDEQSDELADEDEAWQQAAITDWEASGSHIPHPQLAHTRSEGAKVNHPRQSVSKNTQ
ncbi:MAG: type II toxin-antitoxin system ParD family antitoxin [Microcoleus sp.]